MKISTDGVKFTLSTSNGNSEFYSREEAEAYLISKYYAHLRGKEIAIVYAHDGETIKHIAVKAQQ